MSSSLDDINKMAMRQVMPKIIEAFLAKPYLMGLKRKKPTLSDRLADLNQQFSPKHDRADSWKDDIRSEVVCDC